MINLDVVDYVCKKTQLTFMTFIPMWINGLLFIFLNHWLKYIFGSLFFLEIFGYLLYLIVPRSFIIKLFKKEYYEIKEK